MSIRLVAASIAVLVFGPPSIKVSPVANPAIAPVKGAVFMITAHHHQDPTGVTVTGRAEGLVAGKRVTRALTLIPAGTEGLYGVTQQWQAGQPWVLVFSINAPVHDTSGIADAVVRITPEGKVAGIEYPLGKWGTTPWPRRITAAEIDAALAAMAKQ